jgi:hypothetical protein
MDRRGTVAMSQNVSGMGRGHMGADGRITIQFTAAE